MVVSEIIDKVIKYLSVQQGKSWNVTLLFKEDADAVNYDFEERSSLRLSSTHLHPFQNRDR